MQVGIVLGTRSQWTTMKHTAELLAHLGIPYEARIITANKSSKQLHEYASNAVNRGLEIIIAGSTGEIYLPGIIASKTEVPVVGIQMDTSAKKKNSCAIRLGCLILEKKVLSKLLCLLQVCSPINIRAFMKNSLSIVVKMNLEKLCNKNIHTLLNRYLTITMFIKQLTCCVTDVFSPTYDKLNGYYYNE